MTFVLGYDNSPASEEALRVAIELALRFDEPLVVVSGVAPPGGVGEEYHEHGAAVAEVARAATTAAVERAGHQGVSVTAELVQARPADAILDAGERHHARMLIVGSHGEGPLRAAILGSTSHRVLHQATRPVLVVKS